MIDAHSPPLAFFDNGCLQYLTQKTAEKKPGVLKWREVVRKNIEARIPNFEPIWTAFQIMELLGFQLEKLRCQIPEPKRKKIKGLIRTSFGKQSSIIKTVSDEYIPVFQETYLAGPQFQLRAVGEKISDKLSRFSDDWLSKYLRTKLETHLTDRKIISEWIAGQLAVDDFIRILSNISRETGQQRAFAQCIFYAINYWLNSKHLPAVRSSAWVLDTYKKNFEDKTVDLLRLKGKDQGDIDQVQLAVLGWPQLGVPRPVHVFTKDRGEQVCERVKLYRAMIRSFCEVHPEAGPDIRQLWKPGTLWLCGDLNRSPEIVSVVDVEEAPKGGFGAREI